MTAIGEKKPLYEAIQHLSELSTGIYEINLEQQVSFHVYPDVLQAATKIYQQLRANGIPSGTPVIFQLDTSTSFLTTLIACLLGGYIAIPLARASQDIASTSQRKQLTQILQQLDTPVILTHEANVEEFQANGATSFLRIFAYERLIESTCHHDDPIIHGEASDTCMILFTSGSSGQPKGVELTQENLVSMITGTATMNAFHDQDVTLNWMPMTHVGSIVFLGLLPLYLECNQIHIPTASILHRPLYWLELIEQYRASISWAPNFAFSLINQQAEVIQQRAPDLSSMRFLVNAGEQIAAQTVDRSLAILETLGLPHNALRPAFGMTETCSGITWSKGLTRETLAQSPSFISLGAPIPGAQMRVTDELGTPLKEGEIGRLELTGSSVTNSYHKNTAQNESSFSGQWFITGDLAFISQGELYVTGREKQEIIMNGINVPAHDIETCVDEVDGASPSYTCAFAVREKDTGLEQLAIVFSPANQDESTWIALVKQMNGHLTRQLGFLCHYFLPLKTEDIPKTAIGKIQRTKLIQSFESGQFDRLVEQYATTQILSSIDASQLPSSEVECQIAEIWQEILELEHVGTQSNFFELGGYSILLTRAHAQLQLRFGTFPLDVLFKYPTIETLANFFSTEESLESQLESSVQARVQQRNASNPHQDIAIIGMSCRFPGADSLEAFWQNLIEGIESISFFEDESKVATFMDPKSTSHVNYVNASPTLKNAAAFDAEFFGYSQRDAELMDPQHRVFLEVCWETMERAGYNPHAVKEAIGLYAGASMNTYLLNHVIQQQFNMDEFDDQRVMTPDSMGGFQMMVANDKDYLNTRVSYKLDLTGPSLNIQTACSTGLVVVHQALQSIQSGECDMALAGTTSVQCPQEVGHLHQDSMITSPDGHCRAFDANAKGTIFGSGVGCVLLKKLDQAIADGDHIHAVIKGSAVNNDGLMKVGYMAPSEIGQSKVCLEALEIANIDPATIGFVEAHGTGTEMGDPIEVASLTNAFHAKTDQNQYCAIGSVKTNIGHAQISSGIAGLIKAACAIEHAQIPPTLHFQTPNPLIPFSQTPFYVNTHLQNWSPTAHPRRACVNSLGIGGTNAHVVLEQAPTRQAESKCAEHNECSYLLPLSAKTPKALRDLVSRYCHFLSHTEFDFADICYTASVGRKHFDHRVTFLAQDKQTLLTHVQQWLAQDHQPDSSQSNIPIQFLFTGQGSQYFQMGQSLYEKSAVFRKTMDRCDAIYQQLRNQSLLPLIFDLDDGQLHETVETQPILFAIEYSLATLWMSYGVKPNMLIGHSIGEYSAACIAGIFSLEEGMKLVTKRGELIQSLPKAGEMYAVYATQAQLAPYVAEYEKVSFAAINGPNNIVLSGEVTALTEIITQLEKQEIEYQKLHTSHAFHSPLMQPIVDAFKAVADTVTYHLPKIPLISNMTGSVETDKFCDPAYWAAHILSPVHFAKGVSQLKPGLWLEVGPKPTLTSMAKTFCSEKNQYLPSMRVNHDSWLVHLQSIELFYRANIQVQWHHLFEAHPVYRVPLPTYPFQHKDYWLSQKPIKTSSDHLDMPIEHPLVHQTIHAPSMNATFFETEFSEVRLPFLAEHRVYHRIVVAGANHIATILSAIQPDLSQTTCRLEQLIFPEALVIPSEQSKHVQIILEPDGDSQNVQLISFKPGSSNQHQRHCEATLHQRSAPRHPQRVDIASLLHRCPTKIGADSIYRSLLDRQINLGPQFRWISDLYLGENEALAEIRLPASANIDQRIALHPGLIDSMLQPSLMVLSISEATQTYVPYSMTWFEWLRPIQSYPLWSLTQRRVDGTREVADVQLFDQEGNLVANAIGFEFKPVNPEVFLQEKALSQSLYQLQWDTLPLPQTSPVQSTLNFIALDVQSMSEKLQPYLKPVHTAEYCAMAEALEQLAISYILHAFNQLKLKWQPNAGWTDKDILNQVEIIPLYHPMIQRLLIVLEEKSEQVDHLLSSLLNQETIQSSIATLKQRFGEKIHAELSLLQSCGHRLADILQGRADPLSLLFPGGDLSIATQLYQSSPGFIAMNQLMKETLSQVLSELQVHSSLAILEIGAGTGATTHHLLPELANWDATYTFTDISPLFLQNAAVKFNDAESMDFRVLDIEQSPAEQGFHQQYDVIVAANVLHATKDIAQTLKHTRTLLKPGGHLLLLEVNKPTVSVDLTFGLLEGWWRFTDTHLRPDYPLLSQVQWCEQLKLAGFVQSEVVDVHIPTPGGDQRVFVAKNDLQTTQHSSPWLLLCNDKTVSEQISDPLARQGYTTIQITHGSRYHESKAGNISISHSLADFQLLLDKYPHAQGIIFHWQFEESASSAALTCISALNLAKAVSGAKGNQPLYYFSTQSQLVDQQGPLTKSHIESASLWGVLAVLQEEQPELRLTLVDLPASPISKDWQMITASLTSMTCPTQLALRNNALWQPFMSSVSSFEPHQLTEARIDPNSSYLVTGAFGGIGFALLGALVQRGAKHIIAVGRHRPNETQQYQIKRWQSSGVKIQCEKMDIGQRENVQRLLSPDHIDIPLKGIFHIAGVFEEKPTTSLNQTSLMHSFHGKCSGAWLLHEYSQHAELDHFVLFSSAASWLNLPNQGAYAAANQMLDSLSAYRQQLGLPTLCINWGAWEEAGMVASQSETLLSLGHQPISMSEGLTMLFELMNSSYSNVSVLPIHWSTFFKTYRQIPPSLTRIATQVCSPESSIMTKSNNDDVSLGRVTDDDSIDNKSRLPIAEFLQTQVQQLTGTLHPITNEMPLTALGMDSIMNINLKNRIFEFYAIQIPLAEFIDATIDSLAERINEQQQTNLFGQQPSLDLENQETEMEEFTL
ncbi:type I polyketide synthase [Algicola sagamiensis]|uniref:type I polyketide synthase n=1 Tax=Algicola sagamiensis TaxID=163869 RepID=UPI00035FC516|nr:type I polyketide synthase [Algicola sagamiensis]